MGLSPDDLRELLAVFEESTWSEITVSVAGDSLHVSRRSDGAGVVPPPPGGASPVPPAAAPPVSTAASNPAPAAGAQPADVRPASTPGPATPGPATPGPASGGVAVPAPSVGLFWRAPSPGAPPFVDVGTRVVPEDAVGIVEVMKLMNQVPAGVAGVVTAVLVDNGGMVEHGQPLVLIDPAG